MYRELHPLKSLYGDTYIIHMRACYNTCTYFARVSLGWELLDEFVQEDVHTPSLGLAGLLLSKTRLLGFLL